MERPTLDQIWAWLDQIPDPEIPVISLVDLGVIRDALWKGDTLHLKVTPTYSGCPATAVINLDIQQHLRANGIDKLVLERQLSPAWTTDWISEKGRRNLQKFGIAPPPKDGEHGSYGALLGRVVECPRCGSKTTERISQFGSTPCKASYRCTECLEPFDYFKCI
ncbi:phenylacetate-CoA oxygenase subunit PaaJ [Oricola cellulosilytica]|uniref:Phenylacetate-CoA oxygenase subunit PaaJ n=2 Tax=Oricola cellulosilytica TaxID=1429082 RepID=A0A4V2MNA2_9HYPH|nr:phenylacetate-CoA oxygenase subunit PaaJ [Oricola cellulosilytica]